MHWVDLFQHRVRWMVLKNMVMNLRFPLNSGKISSGCTIGGHSRRVSSMKLVTYSVSVTLASFPPYPSYIILHSCKLNTGILLSCISGS